jgi:hypothetical protein
MIKLLYFVAAAFVGYYHLLLGWLLLLPPSLFVLWMVVSTAIVRPDNIPELSDEANKLLRTNYPHYRFRYASVIFAHTAILCWMTSFVLAAFGCFRSFWWGIPIAFVTLFVMGTVANIFNPKYRLTTPDEKAAHQELIDYLDAPKIAARKKIVDELVSRALQKKSDNSNAE